MGVGQGWAAEHPAERLGKGTVRDRVGGGEVDRAGHVVLEQMDDGADPSASGSS